MSSACLVVDKRFGKDAAVVILRVLIEKTIAKQISPPEYRMYHFALATACAAVSDLAISRAKNGRLAPEKTRQA